MKIPGLTWLSAGKWQLGADFALGKTVVPAGEIFDGVSTPWIIQWYLDDTGVGLPAAIPHDYHYRVHDITRKEADDEFWANLVLYCGVRDTKATAAWLVLRAVGWWAWRN
jgi:hypothetical protein